MGEVSAVGQIKSHESVTRLQACHKHGHVCLGSGMRLHICIFRLENFAQAVYGELLNLVNDLASAVVPCSWVSFRIFVRAD